MNAIAMIILFTITCYLIGSIPFGLIISKVFFKTDIRQHGSGNIGTTNAMRSLGRVGGSAVFVLDFSKGLFCGALAYLLFSQFDAIASVLNYDQIRSLTLAACILGHIYSPWLKFKGGKGIACAIGCIFVVFGPVGALLELSIFIVLVVCTRYVSVGSIASAAAAPFFACYYFPADIPAILLCAIGGFSIVFAHRENIKRLISKTENRIGSKAVKK